MANFNYSLDEVEGENSNARRIKELLKPENLRHVLLEADRSVAMFLHCSKCGAKYTINTVKRCRYPCNGKLVEDGNL